MSSISSKPATLPARKTARTVTRNTTRTVPQQERSERRVAAFLAAAAQLFAEKGYDAVTMTEVAARSGSSIGALYNYFPDKPSLAYTLAVSYTHDLESRWKPMIEQAASLTHREFAELFVDILIGFIGECPAYLSLVLAPVRFRRNPEARRASRLMLSNAFRARNPALTGDESFLMANICLMLLPGMMALYAEAEPKARPAVVREWKSLLAGYLKAHLAAKSAPSRKPSAALR
ncbi:TetR/AcrR family transcriptional regulator [Silvibacterium sp.]|uniref:TetR/AcrR family transcriptional regulator n=1 Tax=Silvibacterium sp. TaxID=1964179 RepID=UPI0039E23F91